MSKCEVMKGGTEFVRGFRKLRRNKKEKGEGRRKRVQDVYDQWHKTNEGVVG